LGAISQADADEFYSNFNDKPFNTLEPNTISRLVYVAHVETTTEGKDGGLPIPGLWKLFIHTLRIIKHNS